jgi:hypothetical protein
MDVRQQDGPHVSRARAARRQRRTERRERRRRAGIDQRHAVRAREKAGRDDARLAQKAQIEVVEPGSQASSHPSILPQTRRRRRPRRCCPTARTK